MHKNTQEVGEAPRYQVRCTPRVSKAVKCLPVAIQLAIDLSFSAISHNPRPIGVELLKEDKRTWRLRVGDYRILYWIEDKSRTVLVQRVAHRREAYQKKGKLSARRKKI